MPCKRSYPRNWRAYNDAQTNEISDVLSLLGAFSDLVNLTENRSQVPRSRGRPWFPLGYVVFAVILKAYFGISSRRLESLLRETVEWGYLRNVPTLPSRCGNEAGFDSNTVRIPQFNTVCSFLRSPWLTPLLLELVTATARPLRSVEHEFAVDGTGWGTKWYDRWLDHRLASESDRQQWMKLHLVVGVKTNVIARAAISPGSHHDNPYFQPLVIETAKLFDVEAVLADMAYSSRANHELAGRLDCEVRILFKDNTRPPSNDGSEWSKNLHYFNGKYEKFLKEYNLRSNAETANSAVKRIMPAKIRAIAFDGQTNEALTKVIAYNIRVLAREDRMRDLALDLPGEALFLDDCIREVVEMRCSKSVGEAA